MIVPVNSFEAVFRVDALETVLPVVAVQDEVAMTIREDGILVMVTSLPGFVLVRPIRER